MTAGDPDDELGGFDLFGDRLYNALEKREPAAGMLLIAAPDLEDPNFGRTVVYLAEHHHGGTLGVIINRPSDATVADLLPDWADLYSAPGTLYLGGPVKPDAGIALAVLGRGVDAESLPGVQVIGGRVVVLDLAEGPEEYVGKLEGLRIFVGHAGWMPGQLQDEIDRGDWYVTHSLASDLIAPGHVDVWAAVLGRQDMPLPLYSTYSSDGSLN